jgi:hypothetical protein
MPRERVGNALDLVAVWPTTAADEIVRTVVTGAEPMGAIIAGAKTQTAPEGNPPLQAKVTGELKPLVGFTVRVMALEFLPWDVLVDVADGDRVKLPTASRTLRVVATEVLAICVLSPE